MTLQKAMRIRSELKKKAAQLQGMLKNVNYSLTWEDNPPSSEEEIEEKRAQKLYSLNGMSYAEAVKLLFAVSDACAELNTKIEEVNQKGHNLLYKEACLKSKLAFVEDSLARERRISYEEDVEYVEKEATVRDYKLLEYMSSNTKNDLTIKNKKVYHLPILGDSCFGMSLTDYHKKLCHEIEEIRDELAAFNATAKIDFELPQNLI